MRKHIDRVLLVGATVVVLLMFGTPLAIPSAVSYNSNSPEAEQSVSEY